MTYEFKSDEDKIIDGVGMRGLLIGIIIILIAIVTTIKNLALVESIGVRFILTMIQNATLIMIAIAFILPFYDFRTLAKTEGKDIKELMEGVRKMAFGFIIIILATLIAIITEIVRLMVIL